MTSELGVAGGRLDHSVTDRPQDLATADRLQFYVEGIIWQRKTQEEFDSNFKVGIFMNQSYI